MRFIYDGAARNKFRRLKGPGDARPPRNRLACLLAASLAVTLAHAGFNKQEVGISGTGIDLKAEEGVGGLDFLSDGRMVLLTHGVDKHSNPTDGKLWLLEGVLEGGSVKAEQIAGDMADPLGLVVVRDTIYIAHKDGILRVLPDGSSTMIVKIARSGNYHEYHFSVVHKDGYLYSAMAQAYPPKDSKDRGALLKVSLADGSAELIAGGLRTPNGVAVGPEGALFVTDNQGHWLPTSKMVQVEPGDHFGFENPLGPFPRSAKDQTPPVVWFKHGMSNSPMQPVMIPNGPYATQLLVSDYRNCNLMRVFLEKVQGRWQGAIFEVWGKGEQVSPANRMTWGPDGALYMGGQGRIPNWSATCNDFKIQKVTMTEDWGFEILGMRSVANGFELEFTKAPGPSAMDKGSYSLERWGFKPGSGYGAGNEVGSRSVAIQSVAEGTRPNSVTLVLSPGDLQHGEDIVPSTVFHLQAGGVKGANGEALHGGEAWYTLNKIGPAETIVALNGRQGNNPSSNLSLSVDSRSLFVRGPVEVHAEVRTLDGRVLEEIRATGPAVLPLGSLSTGVHFLTGTLDGVPFTKSIVAAN